MLYLCLVNYFEYLVGVARHGLQAPPQHGASEGAPRGGELLPVADDEGSLTRQSRLLNRHFQCQNKIESCPIYI